MQRNQIIAVFGDSMCADAIMPGWRKWYHEIRQEIPELNPLGVALVKGQDEEFTCKAAGITPKRFYKILERLMAVPGIEVQEQLGANCALEIATLAGLNIGTDVHYLGFRAGRTLARVAERLPEEVFTYAAETDSEAVSLIFPDPQVGKRGILSFGGEPPVRTMSPEFANYIHTSVLPYLEHERPQVLILVGTHVAFGGAKAEDFNLLRQVVETAKRNQVKVVMDLGGLGSWDQEGLKQYFQIAAEADILCMNESELELRYRHLGYTEPFKYLDDYARALLKLRVSDSQALILHTAECQMAVGLPENARQALVFGGKTAALRGATGKFPSVKEVNAASLQQRASMEMNVPGVLYVPAFEVRLSCTVGLGDTFTAATMSQLVFHGII